VQILSQVLDTAGDPLLRRTVLAVGSEKAPVVGRRGTVLIEGGAIELSEPSTLVRIGDHDPMPALTVRPRRGLNRDAHAIRDHFQRYWPIEVHPAANGTRGGQKLIRGQLDHV
jgi:hypothetical protein